MSDFRLTAGRRRRLQQQLQQTPDARVYRRTLALLEADRRRPVRVIAEALRVTPQSVYNWIAEFERSHDPAALRDQPRSGRPTLWTEALRKAFRAALGQAPDRLGYFAVNWTVPLLQDYLRQSTGHGLAEDTIRRELARLGYAWKRGRYVLDPDPELEKKTAHPPPGAAVAGPHRLGG